MPTLPLSESTFFTSDDAPPYRVVGEELIAAGETKCLILCDHAGRKVPHHLDYLGLPLEDFNNHYAYDIGTHDMGLRIAERLKAPVILSNYSRLVVDVNRRIDHPTVFATSGEGKPVPGNIGITHEEKMIRKAMIYDPYHDKVADLIQQFLDRGVIPAILSIHSFTPIFYKQRRPWEVGVLWVQDDRLPRPIMEYFRNLGFTVGDNEPYDARMLSGSTVNRHADAARLPNALVEIRNDLISTHDDAVKWGDLCADCFEDVLQDDSIYSFYDGPDYDYNDIHIENSYFEKLIQKAQTGESHGGQ